MRQADIERIAMKYGNHQLQAQYQSESSNESSEGDENGNYARSSSRKHKMSKKKKKTYYKYDFGKLTLNEVKETLYERIVGQPYAVESIAPILSSIYNRNIIPEKVSQRIFHLLFAGPSGCGKTEMTECVTSIFKCAKGQEFSYLSLRLAMGTYHDGTQLNNIVGSGQGFAGYKDSCFVSDLVKANQKYKDTYGEDAPFIFITLDEICKSVKGWVNLLNSFFDKGELKGGSSNFSIPPRTFLIVLSTANYGEYTNNVLFPTLSIDEIREEMLNDGLEECDVNRIREIIPFFQLKDEDRREIVNRCVKRVFMEYHERNSSVGIRKEFAKKMANYILQKKLKDVRSLENQILKVMISVVDNYDAKSHKGKVYMDFTSYDKYMSKCGDYSFLNNTRFGEYQFKSKGNEEEVEVPCVCLYNESNVAIQCLVLPCNNLKRPREEDEEGEEVKHRYRHHFTSHSQKYHHTKPHKRIRRAEYHTQERGGEEEDEDEEEEKEHESMQVIEKSNKNNNSSTPLLKMNILTMNQEEKLRQQRRIEQLEGELALLKKERDDALEKNHALADLLENDIIGRTLKSLKEFSKFVK